MYVYNVLIKTRFVVQSLLWKSLLEIIVGGNRCWCKSLLEIIVGGNHCWWKSLSVETIVGNHCWWKSLLVEIIVGNHCWWKSLLVEVIVCGNHCCGNHCCGNHCWWQSLLVAIIGATKPPDRRASTGFLKLVLGQPSSQTDGQATDSCNLVWAESCLIKNKAK